MKVLERFALLVYSYIVLLLAVVMCLLVFNWLELDVFSEVIRTIVTGQVTSKITIAVSIAIILLSIKCIFFDSHTEEKIKESQGILLKNENGQLLITKETLDNMVRGAVSGFENVKECTPQLYVNDNNEISITLQIVVNENVIIKDLATNLQDKVKEEMKKSSDLNVKEVNVKILNVNKSKKEDVEKD